jgi:hypothetical protein
VSITWILCAQKAFPCPFRPVLEDDLFPSSCLSPCCWPEHVCYAPLLRPVLLASGCACYQRLLDLASEHGGPPRGMGSPTSSRGEVLFCNQRLVRHIKILSFARKLGVIGIIHSHVPSPASAGGEGLAFQCWRAQLRRWIALLSMFVCVS